LEPRGRFVAASNATLLCDLTGTDLRAVYKPEAGEAPLWDFPAGTLHRREVAAYVVDRVMGFGLVPPTVLREDGPFGRGSVQLFVDHDPAVHYFTLVESSSEVVQADLRRMVVFDLVTNNADRKGGHVLLGPDGHLRLVDHGICFHEEPKVRTVGWDFAGEPLPADAREAAARVVARLPDGPVRDELESLLSAAELAALAVRAAAVASAERFPPPAGPRPYPWPAL